MRCPSFIKKFFVLLIAACTLSFFSISYLNAASLTETYLYYIMQYTNGTLKAINDFPNYMGGLGKLAISWLEEDKTNTTAQMQGDFATLGGLIVQNSEMQNDP